MGTIVAACKAAEVCEIFYALQILSVDGDWGAVFGIDVHRLGLFLGDAQTISMCCIA